MSAELIDGKKVAADVRAQLKIEIEDCPGSVIIEYRRIDH